MARCTAWMTERFFLEKNKKHTIEIAIDRIVVKEDNRSRIAEAVELAIREGKDW